MEKVIKIQSDNSLAQTFDNSNSFPSQKLVDFTIPQNDVYDLTKAYISLNIDTVLTTNNPIDGFTPVVRVTSALLNQATYPASHLCPNSALVKNCFLYCQNKGMIESIRRNDSLRIAQHYLETDDIQLQRTLEGQGQSNNERGKGLVSTFYVDEVRQSNGDDIAGGDTNNNSKSVSKDVKIYLHEIFGFARVAELYDSMAYGETKIHCELNLDRLNMVVAQGLEAQTFPSGVAQGGLFLTTGVSGAQTFGNSLETYDDPEFRCPFFVGQAVLVTINTPSATRVVDAPRVITDILYNGGTQRLQYTFSSSVITAAGGGENISEFSMKAAVGQAPKVRINTAELNLTSLPNQKGKTGYQYRTYTTEQIDGGNTQTLVNKSAKIDPNCASLTILNLDTNQISPDRAIDHYRIQIDNVDISGNRDIKFKTALHKDRILRAYGNKSDALIRNLELNMIKNAPTVQSAMRATAPLAVICEAIELKDEEQNLQLELKAAANCQDIILYKEIIKIL